MSEGTIGLLSYKNYARLLRSLLPGLTFINVHDQGGQLLWKDGVYRGGSLDQIEGLLPAGLNDGGAAEIQSRRLGDGTLLHSQGVLDIMGQPVGLITLGLEAAPGSGQKDAAVGDVLKAVVACMEQEYSLTAELGKMADELTERYEELNLVYEADDQVTQSAAGQDMLQELVRSCSTFLDVGMVALVLPAKRLTFYDTDRFDSIAERQTVLSALKGPFFQQLKENQQAVVLNELSDPLRYQLCPEIPYKLISVPVMGGERDVVGSFSILNHHRKPDFTNSDRNLVQVLAKKAAKVVQASFDALTGLENIQSYESGVREALSQAQIKGYRHAILNIDLDRLQVINDVSGREAGDELIRRIGGIIQDEVRDRDLVARIGGDEFGVLLENCPLEVASRIARTIRENISNELFEWEGKTYEVSASIGVAPLGAETDSSASVLSAVEAACRAAKERGRNQLQVFESNDLDLLRRRDQMHWVSRIQAALREDRFLLYCQPIKPLNPEDGENHFEVLLRMKDEEGQLLSPGVFLPAAEHFDLMPAIDRWVISRALELLDSHWPLAGGEQYSFSLNLSGQSLSDEGFQHFLEQRVQDCSAPASSICFEITESAAIANLQAAQSLIAALRKLGCRFSLDDFGTGLSSFNYLKNLDVDWLKIDGAFVKEIVHDPVSRAMVSAINQVGHALGLQTVAEWVETPAIAQLLHEMGVDYGQGYGLGIPLPLEQQLNLIADGQTPRADIQVG